MTADRAFGRYVGRMRAVIPLALVACQIAEPMVPRTPGGAIDCASTTYPDTVAEPMALGEVIAPYRWPDASLRADDTPVSVDLAQVPCALDDDIDWSPFDVLLFVSIPAW